MNMWILYSITTILKIELYSNYLLIYQEYVL